MELMNLNFDETPLTREDLLRIKGGANASYTVTDCTGCSDTGNPNTADCTDGCKKD